MRGEADAHHQSHRPDPHLPVAERDAAHLPQQVGEAEPDEEGEAERRHAQVGHWVGEGGGQIACCRQPGQIDRQDAGDGCAEGRARGSAGGQAESYGRGHREEESGRPRTRPATGPQSDQGSERGPAGLIAEAGCAASYQRDREREHEGRGRNGRETRQGGSSRPPRSRERREGRRRHGHARGEQRAGKERDQDGHPQPGPHHPPANGHSKTWVERQEELREQPGCPGQEYQRGDATLRDSPQDDVGEAVAGSGDRGREPLLRVNSNRPVTPRRCDDRQAQKEDLRQQPRVTQRDDAAQPEQPE